MPEKRLARGSLRVNYPDSHTMSRDRPGSQERGLEGDLVHGALLEALRDTGFQDVEEISLKPKRTRGLDPSGGAGKPLTLDLDVAAGEDAVVLVEQDGCYSWHLPKSATTRTRRLPGEAHTASFEIPLRAAAPTRPRGRGGGRAGAIRTRGLVGDLVGGAVRALVLKFAAPVLVGKAIDFLERHVEPGLVHIAGVDPATWTRVDRLEQLPLPTGRPLRILLFVHGTFSSTVGAFGTLGVVGAGPDFLRAAVDRYDAVVGFDHPTLSVDPLANATDLLQRVRGVTGGVTFDVVCHSRGGLTTRSFAEYVLPPSGWDGRVGTAVFVAATNNGTHLADPQRWNDLIDLTTNLAAVGAGALVAVPGAGPVLAGVAGALKGLGALVKYLAAYLFTEGGVPGLAAMTPGGAFVTGINQTQPGQPGPGAAWHVVQSNFHVTLLDDSHRPPQFPKELAVRLAEGLVDQVFKGDNDLVVDCASMGSIDAAAGGGFVASTYDFGTNDVVYHGNYFDQADFVGALGDMLFGGEATAAPTIDRGDFDLPTPVTPAGSPPESTPDEVDPGRRRPAKGGGAGGVRSRGITWAGAADQPVTTTAGDFADPGEPATAGADPDEPVTGTADEPVTAAADEPAQAHLLAEMPDRPVVGRPASLRVALSRKEIASVVSAPATGRATIMGMPGRVLDVRVLPKKNCSIQGDDEGSFTLPTGSGTSELRFDVVPRDAGPLVVTVLVEAGGYPLARLTVQATATAKAPKAGGRTSARATAVADPAADAPGLASALWLQIEPVERDQGTTFVYTVKSEKLGLLERFESAPLKDIEGFVVELFRDLSRSFDDHGTGKAFVTALQDRGAQLFDELFPEPLRALLWQHRAELGQIWLLADEPYLPWELVHLKPAKGRRPRTPWFLGQLGLVRSQYGAFPPRVLLARPGRVRSLCPDYLDSRWRLEESAAEAAYLKDRFGAEPVAATERDVLALLRKGDFDLLHFSGHGLCDPGDVASAKIMLAGRKGRGGAVTPQYLSATTVSQNVDYTKSENRPVVVLNACQTARGGQQLSSLGGFARAFLEAGAGAYVSTLWSVRQEPARDFVETFYDRLLGGATVGEASVAAREAARAAGDASWLAYAVYARPDAILQTT